MERLTRPTECMQSLYNIFIAKKYCLTKHSSVRPHQATCDLWSLQWNIIWPLKETKSYSHAKEENQTSSTIRDRRKVSKSIQDLCMTCSCKHPKRKHKRKLPGIFCIGNSFKHLKNTMTKPLRIGHS